MRTRILIIAGLFFLTTKAFSQDPNFHIFLCFGQSNMEGQGAIQSQDTTTDNRFKLFQALDCPNLNRTKETWYPAVPPTCQCYSKLSLVDYFGRTLVANLPDSITIGVINVAVGGCDIRLFDKDIYQDYDSTYIENWFLDKLENYEWNPYKYLIDLAKRTQQDGVIKGILLHQGESNTGQALWPSYVKKIYYDMLAELSLNADEVPLLAGELLSAEGNCCASMNPIINRLPDTIPTAYVISSDGCTAKDGAHFDSEGYRKLGRRYAVQMLALIRYETVYIEAECGAVGENWYILADEDASNSTYVTAIPGLENNSTAPTDEASILQMSVSVSADSSYYLYGRFHNSSSDDDSFWIKIDDDEFELYDNLITNGWEWLELKSLDLTAGEHTICVAFAEDGARLDKLVLKNSPGLPVDKGEEAVNICEAELITGVIDLNLKGYALKQNYPNPILNSKTNISFEIPIRTYVSLKVYDSKGVEIDELAGKEYNAGEHIVVLNLEPLSHGIYFYKIKTEKFSATRKIIIHSK